MIRSMTAFARQEWRGDWGLLTWELRSVNHRFLEVQTRIPEELRTLDPEVRKRTAAQLKRGKVDCTLRFRANPAAAANIAINQHYLQQLLHALQEVEQTSGTSSAPNSLELLRWPGVLEDDRVDVSPVLEAALELLDKAIDEMTQSRLREGNQIEGWITARCDAMETLVQEAQQHLPEIQAGLKDKLMARLAELQVDADPARLEQELVFLAQKTDVSEELDRLNGHLIEVRRVLTRKEPVGRRLDFLMQELNREANTFGAKSVNGETSRISLELKVLVEQMREQVQNIE